MSERPLDLLIVGAGFSGLAMAIQAQKAGSRRFLILEKAPGVGGTWYENTYPGAASDIPSHLYSLSFAPRSDWTRLFPRQPEILAYLTDLVREHGLSDRLRLETDVRSMAWDEATGFWRVESDRGVFEARAVAAGLGPLHHPVLPAIPGLQTFAGPAFHSARWNHDCDLAGRRVGVIGTGASAVQFVPEIVGRVAHLSLFQRSAPWVLPRLDRPIPARTKTVFAHVPFARRLYRQVLNWQRESAAFLGFTKVSRITDSGEKLARYHLRKAIKDEALRTKLTPHYRFGCKRVLLSDDFYPALARPNVSVITEGIETIRPDGILTADGLAHPLDVLIFGTGFSVTGSFERIVVRGRGGRSLAEAWRDGIDAFQGITVNGFPNLFLLLGPNTGLGHNSVLLMIEAQVAHALAALRYLRENPAATLDVTPEAQRRFRVDLEARMAGSIWTSGGCGSWYLDEAGRNRALWPSSVPAYTRGAKRLRIADYNVLSHRQ